jgi:rhamnogalacturonyl hydrolase YesR
MDKKLHFLLTFGLLLIFGAAPAMPQAAGVDADFNDAAIDHGAVTLAAIKDHFFLSKSDLYAEQITRADDHREKAASSAWAGGVQLSALTAAARVNRLRYLPDLRSYVDGLDAYWIVTDGVGGYNSSAYPRSADRYYDDNAWLVLGLVEAYQITHEPKDLQRARNAVKFVLSGQDKTLGGGIWWREKEKNSKNTCSSAPGICALLRVFSITKDPASLKSAAEIYQWTRSTLRDTDGLYFDAIDLNQKLVRTKWTYNSALMIRGALLLYDQTSDASYLKDAQQTAKAAIEKWVKPADGSIAGPACFSHLLAEAMLELSARDHDPQWKRVDHAAVDFLWNHNRDERGWHPERWDQADPQAVEPIRLIDQASAARAFFRAAWAQE